jgi:predicted branched-subunit amino acid permease
MPNAASLPGVTPTRRAVADASPIVLGYLPFGLILGTTIARSPIDDVVGWASSPLMFAGASQLAAIELIDSGAAALVVVATALVINLRHVMYSGGLAPWFRDAPLAFQLAAPYLLADPVYTMSAVRFPELPDPRSRRRYYVVFGLILFVGWSTMTAGGILVGAALPDGLGLELAVPLTFLALLVPAVVDRPTLLAALVGGGVALVADGLPLHLGLLVGALAGITAGVVADPQIPLARRRAVGPDGRG